ncbi:MAG: SAP domain-containing protein [Opitutaceae bacterium]
MKIAKAVESIGTITELKRISSAYVIDYRNLSDDDVRKALLKTAPQYYFATNVQSALDSLFFHQDRQHRILSRLILKEVLLNEDNFLAPKKETEDSIISYEQSIVDRSNEDLIQKTSQRSNSLELFKFLVETAWENNASISIDEKNLLEKVRSRLKITEGEYRILEAKLGKFPKEGNQLHTRSEIEETRRLLQTKGILFSIRNTDGTDFDLIPEEIAEVLRSILGIQIKRHGYSEMLAYKFVRSKKYCRDILTKCEIDTEKNLTLEELQKVIIGQVPPSKLLGGTSPRDGLDISDLKKWCSELNLAVSGTKPEMIERIIHFYDNLLQKDDSIDDERALWYEHFERFAARDLTFLRGQQLIEKDLECESHFEDATDFLFEKRLHHKPLELIGSAHPDGMLSYQDKIICWDNKSKETPVHLKDHLKQFEGYIKSSERPVAGFWVIGPDFTPESSLLAMQFTVESGVTITLIKASELKSIAERWEQKFGSSSDEPFPLGYLIQPGYLNSELIAAF